LVRRTVIIERSKKLFIRSGTNPGKSLNEIGAKVDSGFPGGHAKVPAIDHED
jgi:hypothetical protein